MRGHFEAQEGFGLPAPWGRPSPSCVPSFTAPTCTDGLQNGDEAAVDCGGSCAACRMSCCATGGVTSLGARAASGAGAHTPGIIVGPWDTFVGRTHVGRVVGSQRVPVSKCRVMLAASPETYGAKPGLWDHFSPAKAVCNTGLVEEAPARGGAPDAARAARRSTPPPPNHLRPQIGARLPQCTMMCKHNSVGCRIEHQKKAFHVREFFN